MPVMFEIVNWIIFSGGFGLEDREHKESYLKKTFFFIYRNNYRTMVKSAFSPMPIE